MDVLNDSSGCRLGYINRGHCSGHGMCIENTCICDPGWTGFGDFAEDGQDCNLNVKVVLVLDCLAAGFGFITLFVMLYIFPYKYFYQRFISKEKIPSFNSEMWRNDPKWRLVLFTFFYALFGISFYLVKITQTPQYVGFQYKATVLFAICLLSLLSHGASTLYTIFHFMKVYIATLPQESREKLEHIFGLMEKGLFPTAFVLAVIAFMTMLVMGNDVTMEQASVLFFFAMGFGYSCIVGQVIALTGFMTAELSKFVDDNESISVEVVGVMTVVRDKVKAYHMYQRKVGTALMLSFNLLWIWSTFDSLFYRNSSYILPVFNIVASFSTIKANFSLSTKSSDQVKSAQENERKRRTGSKSSADGIRGSSKASAVSQSEGEEIKQTQASSNFNFTNNKVHPVEIPKENCNQSS